MTLVSGEACFGGCGWRLVTQWQPPPSVGSCVRGNARTHRGGRLPLCHNQGRSCLVSALHLEMGHNGGCRLVTQWQPPPPSGFLRFPKRKNPQGGGLLSTQSKELYSGVALAGWTSFWTLQARDTMAASPFCGFLRFPKRKNPQKGGGAAIVSHAGQLASGHAS